MKNFLYIIKEAMTKTLPAAVIIEALRARKTF